MATAMFAQACTRNHAVMPAAARRQKVPLLRSAMRTPAMPKTRNSTMSVRVPMSPISSPSTAKT